MRMIYSAAWAFGAWPVAPDALISAISRGVNFSTLVRISSVCSPSSGERFTSVIESESLIGLPTDRYLPRVGGSTSTPVPVWRNEGSSDRVPRKRRHDEPLRDYVEEIHKACERAAALTRQLLAFSRKQVLQPK